MMRHNFTAVINSLCSSDAHGNIDLGQYGGHQAITTTDVKSS